MVQAVAAEGSVAKSRRHETTSRVPCTLLSKAKSQVLVTAKRTNNVINRTAGTLHTTDTERAMCDEHLLRLLWHGPQL